GRDSAALPNRTAAAITTWRDMVPSRDYQNDQVDSLSTHTVTRNGARIQQRRKRGKGDILLFRRATFPLHQHPGRKSRMSPYFSHNFDCDYILICMNESGSSNSFTREEQV